MQPNLAAVSPDGEQGPLPAEATVELLRLVKSGDDLALDRLLRRCMPVLQRWARGRLPQSARSLFDTTDLVQEAVIASLRHLDSFEARHQGALQAYLRMAVLNRIRDIARQQQRRPHQTELSEQLVHQGTSPLEQAIGADQMEVYETSLQELDASDREAIIGRIELQYSYEELAVVLDKPSGDAARMAVARAVRRLAEKMRPRLGLTGPVPRRSA